MRLTVASDPYRHLCFEHPTSGDLLRLVPERGGLITSWRCGDEEILYFDAERFADPTKSVRGGIPVLFPICGGLPGDRLPLPQGNFQLPQHGFARDLPWQASALADGSGVALELSDSTESRCLYPFAFALRLELRLETRALAISARVEHRGGDPDGPAMPFSLGLHPYFNVSALNAVRFEGLPPRCFNHQTMAADDTAAQLGRLDAGIDLLLRPEDGPAAGAVRLIDAGNGRTITLERTSPLDLVVLWSDPPRSMVCLEPWSGPRSALISGDRVLQLPPGDALELQCRYRIGS